MASTFTASYSGTCVVCEEGFPEGERLTSTPYGCAHVHCPEPKPLGAVCTGCFTEIASNGECLC
jgi:hypothetical protein